MASFIVALASGRIYVTAPNQELFTWPSADTDPQTPPAPESSTGLSPFTVPPSWYAAALDVRVPITAAIVYAITISALNRYNRARKNKPWAISRSRGFFAFVIAHNIFLAVYSAWTCVGMYKALTRSLTHWSGPDGLTGTVDSLCHMHGRSDLANSVLYNPSTSSWEYVIGDKATVLQTSDAGRLWNEGLSFYGWIFYLSKIYEVLDTLIILAKGKCSSVLQTYHHAGAMICMWVGIRYMSPPIWMFVTVNSGIHAIMYTYYTLAALSIPIPKSIKQSITTLQITQFVVGVTYAALHSCVYYTVPVQVPISSVPAPDLPGGAENVSGRIGKFFAGSGAKNVGDAPTDSYATYRTEYQMVPCINTVGQTFAIWLNVLYLTPLTCLFLRFFFKTYVSRMARPVVKNAMADGKVPFLNGHSGKRLNGRA